jgi:predicted DCC family thiol-disulfide oxidoreductase YuxK
VHESGLDVVYDGLCRFCARSLAALQRLAGRPLWRLHDANDHEAIRSTFPMLAGTDTDRAMFVVTPRGEVFRGFFAYRRMMRESPRLYPFLALLHAPGAALIGPWIYAWVARNRRRFGCSVEGSPAQCGVSGSSAAIPRGKVLVGALGLLLMGATVAPIAQNWSPQPTDNFPFSYYPMFSQRRGETYEVNYIVGIDAAGNRNRLSHELAGDGGFNQTRRQINRLIRENRTRGLCRAVAQSVARDTAPPSQEVVTVQLVTGWFRFADYFRGTKAPEKEVVRASCPVVRP